MNLSEQDEELRQRLYSLSIEDNGYWSFKGKSNREYSHGLFQYPAMMVPQLVRSLLTEILTVHHDIKTISDPFMGSGTVLTESKLKGLNFFGTDINPLAVLLCKIKNSPYEIEELQHKTLELKESIKKETPSIDVNFHNIDKWFRKDVQVGLSILRNSIKKENCLWVRRFFWVALAETVRNNSNSRTSTFKLHTRTAEDIGSKTFNPIAFFIKTLERNIMLYKYEKEYLANLKFLYNGIYASSVNVYLQDIKLYNHSSKSNLIITSPPYGDNATTVPYGQYSYLPLQWIDLSDIDESIPNEILSTTRVIDFHSIGGSLANATNDYKQACERSPSLANYSDRIKSSPKDRLNRVAAFFRDFNLCIPNILNTLDDSGLMVWVLGNRKVGGERVPFDNILIELLESYNAGLICKLVRTIPSKRMAIKNSVSKTMTKESIVVLRKN